MAYSVSAAFDATGNFYLGGTMDLAFTVTGLETTTGTNYGKFDTNSLGATFNIVDSQGIPTALSSTTTFISNANEPEKSNNKLIATESWTFYYTFTITQDLIDNLGLTIGDSYTFSADFDGAEYNASNIRVADEDTGESDEQVFTFSLPPANPSLALTKTATPLTYDGSGDLITYSFAVENTGNVALSNLVLDDPLISNEAPVTQTGEDSAYNIGDTDDNGSFDPGEIWQYSGSYTTTSSDTRNITNTATATASFGGEDYESNDTATVYFTSLILTKTADKTSYTSSGETINYEFSVINNGGVDLENLNLVDPLLSNEAPVTQTGEDSAYNIGDTDDDGTFDQGEIWQYSGSYTVQSGEASDIVNTAVATAYYGEDSVTGIDSWTVQYAGYEGLSQGYWGQHISGKNADPTWGWIADDLDTPNLGEGTYRDTNTTFEKFFFDGAQAGLSWGTKVKGKTVTTITDVALTDAVNLGGSTNSKFSLARDAVAAVLNAESVNYKYDVTEIIGMVRDAFNINDGGANAWSMNSLQAELNLNNTLGLNTYF